MEADKIQNLIQKCLSGGTAEDWKTLKNALDSEEYAALRKDLFQLGQFKAEDLHPDEEKIWQSVSRHRTAGRNRLRLSQRIMRYAAVIAIPLMIGATAVWVQRLKHQPEITSATLADFAPGQPRAILKLETGEQIDLTTVGQDTVLMCGGVAICLDSARSISYQPGHPEGSEVAWHTISVPRGGEYRLALPDGSVVWLNSDSELRFPMAFSGEERKVFLRGEAFFDVARNTEHPFIVEVVQMEVKVLGTRFNVNAYGDDGAFRTTLVQGKVEVSSRQSARSVILSPDEQAEVRDGDILVRDVDASIYTAWMQGKFYFESETLEKIAAQLERWYDIEFFFSREELKQYEFTGVIRRDYTAEKILDIIAKTTNVQFEVKNRTVIAK